MKSKLNPNYIYNEISHINIQKESVLWNLNIYNIDVLITIGNSVHIENDIIYYPIYGINNGKIVRQLGIYEIYGKDKEQYLDLNDDLNLEILLPLFFNFVDRKYIEKNFKYTQSHDEETSTIKDNWVNHYLKSNDYNITDVGAGGDCLFFVIQYALKNAGINITIREMRNLLVYNVTEDIYDRYKTIYETLNTEIDTLEKKILKIKDELIKLREQNSELTKQLKIKGINEKDIKQQKTNIKIKYSFIHNEYTALLNERNSTLELLKEQTDMSNINSLKEFKQFIVKPQFWADTWAISVLEKSLHIKLIIFSKPTYDSGNMEQVLQCKEYVNPPIYYILTNYLGDHYQIISFKNKNIFKPADLPKQLADLYSSVCPF